MNPTTEVWTDDEGGTWKRHKVNESRYAGGVWVAYRMSEYQKPVVISLHSEELTARRAAMAHFDPDADVMCVEWDESIDPAWAAMQTVINV